MAKKRFKVRRTKSSTGKIFRRKKSSNKLQLFQIDSMAYGAVRAKISNMLLPVFNKIPLGSVADEVGMGAVNYLIAKNTSGLIKQVALKGLVIENARVGEALIDGSILGTFGNNNKSSNGLYIN